MTMTFKEKKDTLNKNWKIIEDKKRMKNKDLVLGDMHSYTCKSCDYSFKHDLDKGSVFCPECNSIDVKEI